MFEQVRLSFTEFVACLNENLEVEMARLDVSELYRQRAGPLCALAGALFLGLIARSGER